MTLVTTTKRLSMCIALLLTAQMYYTSASEHNVAGRVISEYNEVQQAGCYMKQYRQCLKETK